MEGTHMLVDGEIAELIIKLDPSIYRKKHIGKKKWNSNALSEIINALNGSLQAMLLLWNLLSKTIQEWGFKINEYDRCNANEIINGTQFTIISPESGRRHHPTNEQ